jgi:xanthine dehydrogenase accessory factor
MAHLVVFGANDMATYLLRWAPDLGYDTTLVESRGERVTDEQRALAGAVASSIADVSCTDEYDAVHADHDAPDLGRELALALRGNARTVSLIAARRHAAEFVARVRDAGATEAETARINAPAGLDLGGKSAPEIALSVLAGLVAAQYGRSGGWLA